LPKPAPAPTLIIDGDAVGAGGSAIGRNALGPPCADDDDDDDDDEAEDEDEEEEDE
jgi:hypothetical protein